MIKLKKEIITKTYMNGCLLNETVMQYHYDTEKEKLEHSKKMQEDGFSDSGQVKENVGTIMSPDFVWFGSYFKNQYITI